MMLQELLHRPMLSRYIGSMFLSTMAYQMLAVAIGWQVYDLTGSAMALGLVGLFQFIPQLLLTLIVGHFADQYDRRTIVIVTRLIQCGLVSVFALGNWFGWINLPVILLCTALLGAAKSFESPAQQALLPALVDTNWLPRALAFNSSFRETAVIVGPAMGGLLYALQADLVYWTCAVFFLLSSVTLSALPKATKKVQRQPITWDTALAGIRFIRQKPVLLGAISLDLFSVLLGGATALLPIFAKDILHTGPWGLGLLRAAPSVGAIVMSLLLARYTIQRHAGSIMFGAVAMFGISTLIFGLSQSFGVSLLALVILGASDMVSVVIRSSLIQLETPDAMRGRVSAVNSIFIGASNQLGEFESGITAAWLGAVPAVLLGGVGTLVVVGVWIYCFPLLAKRQALNA
jgi:MFS family permease